MKDIALPEPKLDAPLVPLPWLGGIGVGLMGIMGYWLMMKGAPKMNLSEKTVGKIFTILVEYILELEPKAKKAEMEADAAKVWKSRVEELEASIRTLKQENEEMKSKLAAPPAKGRRKTAKRPLDDARVG